MFEDLDTIDWSNLNHAYGSAADVPELLRALTSENEESRGNAIGTMYTNIYHQGTVYEATAYAVPFLLELLQNPDTACKADILGLLAHLAHGYSYIEQHQDLSIHEHWQNDPEISKQREIERSWVRNAHEAVAKGLPLFRELLQNPEAGIRIGATYVLSRFLEAGEENIAALLALWKTEEDARVRASILFSYSVLSAYDSPCLNLLANLLEKSNEQLIKVVAALLLAKHTKCPPAGTADVMLATLADPTQSIEAYNELPWSYFDLVTDICHALQKLPPRSLQRAVHMLLAMLEAFDQVTEEQVEQNLEQVKEANQDNPHGLPEEVWKIAATMQIGTLWTLFGIAELLLYCVFDGQAAPVTITRHDLTEDQYKVLKTIVKSKAAWEWSGNMNEIMWKFLPLQAKSQYMYNRDMLQDFLGLPNLF